MNTPFAIGSRIWPGLSKLIEEAGEVSQVCGKLLGTGGVAKHWDGSDLRSRLEEELSDLLAACMFVVEANGLDLNAITARHWEKLQRFRQWHIAGDPPPDPQAVIGSRNNENHI